MEIYTQETTDGRPSKFILQLDRREARTLVEIVAAAADANRRRSTFRAWRKTIETKLFCF